MKQQHISIFSINSLVCLLLFCFSAHAQNDSITSIANDSVKIKLKYGLRVGGDIGKLIRSTLDDEYSGFEISADYRIKQKLYIAGELGYEEKTNVNEYLNVTTKGGYIKGGIDYNMYQNWLDMDNMVYFGFRVGGSTFSHDLNNYTIYNTTQYWNQYTSEESKTIDGLTAFWAEIILGIKVELFTNLYLGLNAQLKFLATETDPGNFQNIYIPGFHKTYDSSGIGVGYGYTLSYRIPLYKKEK
ncbi:DUF6048 family protein [Aestuariibaculum sediminum]|uniref:Outer membrane protein beta-barrel domain-containing protein n=1 Tax=Aestuariibaculum sediminum TaxID=2770637 RepID=A0A8J6QAC8_9FLAO|nr:DUF6048 family protein [Aestuariibaculum sediminum]MBD0831771.1 hypothetical protein [Aestuariibaculum sediminum]